MAGALRVRLVHWNAGEARQRAALLQEAGYRVQTGPITPTELRALRDQPPDVVVIDLNRLPSQGRDVGIALRMARGTRRVPLVFVDGEREKVNRIRGHLPDAIYATWNGIRGAIRRALRHTSAQPVVPKSLLEAYGDAPLAKKLGIRPRTVVTLIDAPQGFEATLGALPEGATVRRTARGGGDLSIWFCASASVVERGIGRIGAAAGKGGLWIAWPKRASGIATDLSQPIVRKIGLAAGLVDFKVCAIDDIWTGLRFRMRGTRRPARES